MDNFDRLLDIELPGDDGEGSNRQHQNKKPQKEHSETLANKSVIPPVMAGVTSSDKIISAIKNTKDIKSVYGYDDDSWTSGKIIAAIIILGMIILTGLFFLKDPLMSHIEMNRKILRSQEIESQNEKQYENLEYTIITTLKETDERLIKLNLKAKSIAAKLEANIGMSLKYLVENPEERPKELNDILIESETFARNWSAIINTVLVEYPPTDFRLPLSDIHNRIKAQKLMPADRKLLIELTIYLDKTESVLEEQSMYVNEIIDLIKIRQLEKKLMSMERD